MNNLARTALIPIAVMHFLAPFLPSLGFGQTMAVRAVSEGIPPELPLGLFFSIWGVIFIAYLGLAVIANLRPAFVEDHLAAPLALAGIGNIVWMISAQSLGYVWLDFLLLIPILLCAWEAAYRLDVIGGFDGTGRRLLTCLVVGLMAGWLSVAVSISLPDVARWLLGRGVSDAIWQSLWLALVPAAGLAWIFSSRVSHSLWYFAALGWGLVGIISNNWLRTETHALAIAAFVIGWIVIGRRLRYGASGASNAVRR